jgi:hypothetical protein
MPEGRRRPGKKSDTVKLRRVWLCGSAGLDQQRRWHRAISDRAVAAHRAAAFV